jgi:hypothetical protein
LERKWPVFVKMNQGIGLNLDRSILKPESHSGKPFLEHLGMTLRKDWNCDGVD